MIKLLAKTLIVIIWCIIALIISYWFGIHFISSFLLVLAVMLALKITTN